MVTLKDVRDALREAYVLLDRNPENVHILVHAIIVKAVDDLQDIEAGEGNGTDTSERTQT